MSQLDLGVPLDLCSADGDPRPMTMLTSYATAASVALAGRFLETLLPADKLNAEVVRRRWG